jgi:hypothetical protein
VLQGLSQAQTIEIPNRFYSKAMTGSIALNNTTVFFNVISIDVGRVGVWEVYSQMLLQDAVAGSGITFYGRMWDGVTTFASGINQTDSVNWALVHPMWLLGIVVNPKGPLVLQANDSTGAGGFVEGNQSGLGFDTSMCAFRIA